MEVVRCELISLRYKSGLMDVRMDKQRSNIANEPFLIS